MDVDYSNTIIYKITCKDPQITDLYVGHTTNFVQRKHSHKQGCINEKSNNYNCKLYKTIRANGGWDNWVMEIVAFFKCNDHYEARIKEQEHFTSLNATLNSVEPLPKPKSKPIETEEQLHKTVVKKHYFCETCNITLQNQQLLDVHNQTKKHCKRVMGVETKNGNKFWCEICHYNTSKKSSFDKHIITDKHKNRINDSKMVENDSNLVAKVANYVCDCGKIYRYDSGYYRHKKTCKVEEKSTSLVVKENITDKDQLILMLIKQNSALIKETSDFKNLMVEQQNMMMKVLENGTNNTTNTIQKPRINTINSL